jgi:hypothetical protein
VGKAKKDVGPRDLQGHFGMCRAGRNPQPAARQSDGASDEHDEDLSLWMKRRLRLAICPHENASALGALETEVLKGLFPPLA